MAAVRLDGYVVAEKLGSGSFAEVYKAYKRNQSRDVVAVKCVEKNRLSKTALNNIVSEIEILKKLNHDNIVKLVDFTWDDTYICIIMEYCSGGSLLDFIHKHQRLPERICQRFLQQLVKALKYLREQNISHFDLKPQNILLASKRLQILKIGDFGLAQFMTEDETTTLVQGSPLYMAPEIVLQHQYDARADIWSVGVILFECLFGKAPYSSKTIDELIQKIKNNKPIVIPQNASISTNCVDFLKNCLQRDLSKRFDFDIFFSHPFVDLEHAPSSESLIKATEHLTKAVNLEKNLDHLEAYHAYNEGIKYLLPVMYIEADATKRIYLRQKITNYIGRMEVLKQKTKLEDLQYISVVNIPTHVRFGDVSTADEANLAELMNLSTTTPAMAVALEIVQSAKLYEREKNYKLALEKYELALGKLLTLLHSEPKGRRKELLIEHMNMWMDHAEYVKAIVNGVQSERNINEADLEKTCSIQ